MDGDSSAKTLDKGASAAAAHTEMGQDALHETAKPKTEPMGEKTTGTGTAMFNSQGAIGKQFTEQGSLGGTAQKVGGPFDKQGAIGKQFTEGGSIGGSVQNMLGKGEESTFNK
ncbi:MAG: hypothetical protein M1828_005253 [Chrysothrix sp. TS-e1954]|nr:MAG: hypothetical protein M1828_005253 [Chrysothrix sp. TS-e1954]